MIEKKRKIVRKEREKIGVEEIKEGEWTQIRKRKGIARRRLV